MPGMVHLCAVLLIMQLQQHLRRQQSVRECLFVFDCEIQLFFFVSLDCMHSILFSNQFHKSMFLLFLNMFMLR